MADITIKAANSGAINAARQSVSITANRIGNVKSKASDSGSKRKESAKSRKDLISVSRDGDTAHANDKAKHKLVEQSKENTALIQARAKAERTVNNLYMNIAGEEMADDLTGDATVEVSKVHQKEPNRYIEEIKRELKREIVEANNDIGVEVETEIAEPIEVQSQPVIPDTTRLETLAATIDTEGTKYEPQITSFKGYSDQQLRQMYLSGTISRYAYDTEMTSRTEEDREFSDREQVFREGIVRNLANRGALDRSSDSIEEAFSDEASDTLTGEQRMAIFNAADSRGEQVEPDKEMQLSI
ncbi:hypothetical protein [Butyrivibrio sp. AE3006]|uniref:hypothetical protein n=1 Tax=Butyrivibrio sp. AE3006 TaxID=1280673 RepID=UPI0004066AD2|nr:hypothetical protein [Butyrivibrio sp. AE3006]